MSNKGEFRKAQDAFNGLVRGLASAQSQQRSLEERIAETHMQIVEAQSLLKSLTDGVAETEHLVPNASSLIKKQKRQLKALERKMEELIKSQSEVAAELADAKARYSCGYGAHNAACEAERARRYPIIVI